MKTYLINGNRVEVKKIYRNRTQFEWFLTIFMGDTDTESILNYQTVFLAKKHALNHAKEIILNAKKPRVEKVIF